MYKNKNYLQQKYIKEKLSCGKIAKELNVNPETIRLYLIRFRMKRRNLSESHKGLLIGKNNPAYGKVGKLSHTWKENPKYRRQGYDNARRKMERHLGRKLKTEEHVHHIDENVFNNKINNLKVLHKLEHIKITLHKKGLHYGNKFKGHRKETITKAKIVKEYFNRGLIQVRIAEIMNMTPEGISYLKNLKI